MPATPPPANPVVIPNETVELDGAAVLAAIDKIHENLGAINGAINLSLRTDLTREQTGNGYNTQEAISRAMSDLQRLRQGVLRGDGTPLQEILDGE